MNSLCLYVNNFLSCSVYYNRCNRDMGNCIEGKYGNVYDMKCGVGCVLGCNWYKGDCVC